MKRNEIIVPYCASITRKDRAEKLGHAGCVVWFTGLSGAGKSTLAHSVEKALFERGCRTFVLDGDNFRSGVGKDLGFSDEDRNENIRRAGEIAKLFLDSGAIVLAAFISPLRKHREFLRNMLSGDFIEIYCKASIDVCETRDVKGLYKKARAGEIGAFTGISSPYEAPENPELIVETDKCSVEGAVAQITELLERREVFRI